MNQWMDGWMSDGVKPTPYWASTVYQALDILTTQRGRRYSFIAFFLDEETDT